MFSFIIIIILLRLICIYLFVSIYAVCNTGICILVAPAKFPLSMLSAQVIKLVETRGVKCHSVTCSFEMRNSRQTWCITTSNSIGDID